MFLRKYACNMQMSFYEYTEWNRFLRKYVHNTQMSVYKY
jgi:hypothetical protein